MTTAVTKSVENPNYFQNVISIYKLSFRLVGLTGKANKSAVLKTK